MQLVEHALLQIISRESPKKIQIIPKGDSFLGRVIQKKDLHLLRWVGEREQFQARHEEKADNIGLFKDPSTGKLFYAPNGTQSTVVYSLKMAPVLNTLAHKMKVTLDTNTNNDDAPVHHFVIVKMGKK